MSRRKKRSADRNRQPPAARPTWDPNPPRPNKAFLSATILLVAVWVTFLIVMVVAT